MSYPLGSLYHVIRHTQSLSCHSLHAHFIMASSRDTVHVQCYSFQAHCIMLNTFVNPIGTLYYSILPRYTVKCHSSQTDGIMSLPPVYYFMPSRHTIQYVMSGGQNYNVNQYLATRLPFYRKSYPITKQQEQRNGSRTVVIKSKKGNLENTTYIIRLSAL